MPLSRQRRPGLPSTRLPDIQDVLPVIAERLSAERLHPYKAICAHDLAAAMALYEWNSQTSGAWWALISHFEVVVRNTMHERLTEWSLLEHGDGRWYIALDTIFSDESRKAIADARRRVAYQGRGETPGRVVAELTLGFWCYLLSAHYERTLWRVCLYRAWPGKGLRREVHDGVRQWHRLRNRIAHHEPIHDRPLDELHRSALRVVGWICPLTAEWIGERSAVPGLLRRRPGRLGSPN